MSEKRPIVFHGLMVQGKLLWESAEIVEPYVTKFQKKSLLVTAFGPAGYKKDGFWWSQGDSALTEIQNLVERMFCQDGRRWVHQHEIMLIADELHLVDIAIDHGFGAVVYLGRATEEFLAREGSTVLLLPDTIELELFEEPVLMEV